LTILQHIIAEGLILVDGIISQLVNNPSYVGANSTSCTPAAITSNGLTTCGAALVAQMGQLIVQQLALDAARLTALGVS
jgi:hypothetical protein